MNDKLNRRIIVIDDKKSIHEYFHKVLRADEDKTDDPREASNTSTKSFELDYAYRGRDGVKLVQEAREQGRPFAVSFVDMRLTPGWDGPETARRILEADPRIQVVICRERSDCSWKKSFADLSVCERILIQRKPFDISEIRQLASALTGKWNLARKEELAGRCKNQFLAAMSHEIRTPMTAILGYTDLLMDMVEDQDCEPHLRAEALSTIKRSGKHLLTIINDILDLAKLEEGRLDVEHIPFSPAQLAEDSIRLMRAAADSKEICLELAYSWPLPEMIESDPVRLKQILVNLIGNGIKFTSQGGVRVKVGLERDGTDKGMLCIEVADSGIGLHPEQIGNLFKPFIQAESSTTRHYGGSGLGLTISRRLARLLGGDIRVSSVPEVGSYFKVLIDPGDLSNTRMLESGDKPAVRKPDERGTKLNRRLSGRVLLVDDTRDNRRLISSHLERAGLQVELARDGAEAVELALTSLAHGRPHDLILMDMIMPELDGYAATRLLRSEGHAGPIVALTALAMTGDREKCLAAGCDEYVSKPIDRRKLFGLIETLLANGNSRAEGEHALPQEINS